MNPRGFGYIKDRRHVAGFETHRFSQVPAPAGAWKVRTLELVSLLLHDEPAVYVSDHLPRMEHRSGIPTRPLDRFERFGLGALRRARISSSPPRAMACGWSARFGARLSAWSATIAGGVICWGRFRTR